MKREFNMSYKQDIIEGKVEVVTYYGEMVEIVKWNCKGNYPILAVIDDGDTSDSCFYDVEGLSPSKKDRIYVLTDEPELTEFETAYLRIVHKETPDGIRPNFIEKNYLRENCQELLDVARKQILDEWNQRLNDCQDKFTRAYCDGYRLGLKHGKEEILEDIPGWMVATEDLSIGCLVWDKTRNFHLYSDKVVKGDIYISIADILRLPGSPKEK